MKRERFVKVVEETESLLIITGTWGQVRQQFWAKRRTSLHCATLPMRLSTWTRSALPHLPSAATNDGVMYRNLQSVCKNYASFGVRRSLLARAMEDRAELELCRGAVSAANTVVCRLTASIEAMQQRVKMRKSGVSQREYVARSTKLNVILDRARLEDFTVTSERRSLTEVAHEMLVKAGWISN